ncbi:MAG: S8 family peptidase, partial [Gammaproteobacteria bacterium]|nr:S8 family peptidase [Gammaproteobacteria bacterium]
TDHPLVLYIHGIGQQPPPDDLKLEWDLALFGRDMRDRTRMAYWSDILHGEQRTRSKQTTRAGSGMSIDTLLAQAGVDTDNENARRLANALLRTIGVEDASAHKKVLPLPAPLRKPIAQAFLKALIKDTAAYFFRSNVREQIQKRLRDILPVGKDPVIIVAHSQGSIITLEVLAALKTGTPVKIDHLITLGSPLGIREVQDFLSCELKVPGCVNEWHNFADPLDPVALDKGISGDFEPDQFITDELIINAHSRRLVGFNPHSAAGYLAHPKVRKVVHAAARVDAHARFLVARDVAADLAVTARHPVLIEILEPGYPAVDEQLDKMREHEETVEQGKTDPAARIEKAAKQIEEIVGEKELKEARVDRLRRFVAARLTPAELRVVARRHRDLRIYAVWKSTTKRKLLHRSARVIQADAARASYSASGDGILWAVLDTGVRHDHPHFKPHSTISAILDCTKPGPPVPIQNDRDRDGHGTHVAGIIAGAGDDMSIQGIAPRAKLVVYKVLDDTGAGEDAWIIKALDHITEQNENTSEIVIHGLNLSLGGPYDSTVYGCGFSPICMELRRLWRAGVLVCVASGNEGQVQVTTPDGELDLNNSMSIGDPANLEDCIVVGSVNADHPHLYGVSSFSSRGPTSDGRMKPDVVAPGERIRSCNSRFQSRRPESLYCEESGTSLAAPHVSGLLAAFLSVRREFRGRPDEVKQILLRTCTDIRRDQYHQGHGIPNLMRMLLEA